MKLSKKVALVLALGLSLGALVVSCNEASNLQEVLKDQQKKTRHVPVYHLVEEISPPAKDEAASSESQHESVPTIDSWEHFGASRRAQEAQPDKSEEPANAPVKRVKVITIAAPDYSIRFEAKSDAPLLISSEGIEPEPTADESLAQEEEAQKRHDDIESMAIAEAATGQNTSPPQEQTSVGEEEEGESPAEEATEEVEQKEVKPKSEKKKKQGKKGEKTGKADLKHADTEGHKRSKRDTKKSGSSKNGKTKRSAEKAGKYNKGKSGKSKSKRTELKK